MAQTGVNLNGQSWELGIRAFVANLTQKVTFLLLYFFNSKT